MFVSNVNKKSNILRILVCFNCRQCWLCT